MSPHNMRFLKKQTEKLINDIQHIKMTEVQFAEALKSQSGAICFLLFLLRKDATVNTFT